MVKRFILVLFFLFISQSVRGGVCENVDLKRHVPIPPPYKVVSKREVHGLCEIILEDPRGRMVSVYASPDFVIVGRMFVDGRQISIERFRDIRISEIKEKFKSLKTEVDKVAAITYRPKNAKGTVYIFTDPVCPFCQRAEKFIKDWLGNHKIEFKIVFFPVHLPKGKNKAIEAVCKHLDLATYLEGKWGSEEKLCEEGKKLIDKSIEISRKIGIRGVPAFISDEGEVVQGFDTKRLKTLLLKIESRGSK